MNHATPIAKIADYTSEIGYAQSVAMRSPKLLSLRSCYPCPFNVHPQYDRLDSTTIGFVFCDKILGLYRIVNSKLITSVNFRRAMLFALCDLTANDMEIDIMIMGRLCIIDGRDGIASGA